MSTRTGRSWCISIVTLALATFSMAALVAPGARAHCDTLDGPVVADARQALTKGDVTPVLKWIRPAEEKQVRETFAQALTVRAKGADAQALADRHFFETLVRLHRAGEGAPYTGLQPAGSVEPGIREADRAMETGSVNDLSKDLASAVSAGVNTRYARVMETKRHAGDSVEAGRAYVAAYVEYIHYIEGLHKAAAGPAGHGAENAEHTD